MSLVYLSRAEVERALPEPAALVECVEAAYAARARGEIMTKPKIGLFTESGNFFFSLAAAWEGLGYALTHASFGTPLDKTPPGRHHVGSIEVLVETKQAQPVCVFDAFHVALMLPAAVTAVAAKYLARKDASVAGFVAAGAQARANLATLSTVRAVTTVLAYDENRAAADSFVRHAQALGLQAQAVAHPREAVEPSDLVVTSVPYLPGMAPALEPEWLKPGATASMVDLARSWRPGLERLDRLVTDDREQAAIQAADGRLKFAGPFDTELAELVSGARPPRRTEAERAAFIHPGHAMGALAIAAAIYKRAKAQGLGTSLAY